MNKVVRIALSLLFTCYVSMSYAQQRWSAGPRLGLNLSTFGGDVSNQKLLPGLAAGGFLMYSSDSFYGISADLLFSQRGAAFDQTNTNTSYNQRLNYLEIPLAFRFFLNEEGSFRPNLFLGPSIAFLLNARRSNFETRSGNGVVVGYPDEVNTSSFNKTDVGLMGGLQLNWRVRGRERFLVDARYTYGLTDISPAIPRINNSTISLTLGYGFGIGRRY